MLDIVQKFSTFTGIVHFSQSHPVLFNTLYVYKVNSYLLRLGV